MNGTIEQIYVRPRRGEFEVLKPGHRRGPNFATEDAAIAHAKTIAPLVLVLNRSGKVEREVRAEKSLAALVARYEELVHDDVNKDGDCHWQIGERWSYGEHAGWFVEHYGSIYVLADGEFGEDGPHPSREAAESCMAEHLRAAIAQARARW